MSQKNGKVNQAKYKETCSFAKLKTYTYAILHQKFYMKFIPEFLVKVTHQMSAEMRNASNVQRDQGAEEPQGDEDEAHDGDDLGAALHGDAAAARVHAETHLDAVAAFVVSHLQCRRTSVLSLFLSTIFSNTFFNWLPLCTHKAHC